jgi:NADPH-dependent 2,4-dienoyl-CoA reductase/sulfur reductase-like enzyme
LNTKVTYVDNTKKLITVNDGKSENFMAYDKLLIATGCRAREVKAPGAELPNVFQLQDADDAVKVKNWIEGLSGATKKRVVVFGAGYVGMEAAASLKKNFKDDIEVVIVNRGKVIMANSNNGPEVGSALVKLHEDAGTKFMTGRSLKCVNAKDGKAYSVTLDNGDIINAQVIITSQGVVPNTEFTNE